MQIRETIDHLDENKVTVYVMPTLKLMIEDGGIAVVTLANPPINALDAPLLWEMAAMFDGLAADPSVRAAVLTGAVDGFALPPPRGIVRPRNMPNACLCPACRSFRCVADLDCRGRAKQGAGRATARRPGKILELKSAC